MEAIAVNVRDPNEIERTITDFGRSANGGLIVTGSGLAMTVGRPMAGYERHSVSLIFWLTAGSRNFPSEQPFRSISDTSPLLLSLRPFQNAHASRPHTYYDRGVVAGLCNLSGLSPIFPR